MRNMFEYAKASGDGGDEYEYELEFDYGFAPNHHLIFEVPLELGEGAVAGNGDVTLGWHWRLWEEQAVLPAFALRNYVRFPTGYDSSGMDYELKGLFTKSIIPDKLRLHLNPFLKSVNGDIVEDARHFQWGCAVGADYRITEDVDLVFDYVHESSETPGHRNQHSLDFGANWQIAPNHKLGFNFRAGLDGDGDGEDFGVGIAYTISFDGLPAWGG